MRAKSAVLVLLCLGAALRAQDLPRVTLQVEQVPAADVLADLARQAGLKLRVRGQLPATRLTLVMRQVPLAAALDEVCRRIDYTWTVTGKALRLEPRPVVPSKPRVAGVPEAVAEQARQALVALRSAPSDTRRLAVLGHWLQDLRPDWQRQVQERLPELWRGDELDPTTALVGAKLLVQLGALDGALRLLPTARREPKLEGAARRLGALIELQRGSPARALAEATLAARLDPDDGAAAALQAEAALYLGRQEEALAEAMAAQARWPNQPEVLATLGNILRHDPDAAGEADRWLRRALDRAPDHPDALFGLAVLAAREPGAGVVPWQRYLRAEPFSLRADRVRLRLSAVTSTNLTDRGGPVWDVTRDGERCLYTMKFRKQLEIADTHGTGLALQVTDQESDKTWASLSPDEQHLAWVVPAGDGDQLFLQVTNASGQQQQIAKAEPRGSLRRTTWSPDGRWLLFTERRDGPDGPANVLRCWDLQESKEVPPPAFAQVPGLGDVAWRPDGRLVGTVLAEHRQLVVAVEPNGDVLLLRPAAGLRTYGMPTLDSACTRVAVGTGELLAASPDGSEGGEVPVLASSSDSDTAVWVPNSNVLLVAVGNLRPTAIECAGLPQPLQWLTHVTPLLERGPQPPTYEFRLRNLTRGPQRVQVQATVISDDNAATWQAQKQLALPPGAPGQLTFQPTEAATGVHWLRVETTVNGVAERVRWYRYEVLEAPKA